MKILVACVNGYATSQMMKGKVRQALLELGIKTEKIDEFAIEGNKNFPVGYDIIFCPIGLEEKFKKLNPNTIVIGMKNILSVNEAKEHLLKENIAI